LHVFLFAASQRIHVFVSHNFKPVKSSEVTCFRFVIWWSNCLENVIHMLSWA